MKKTLIMVAFSFLLSGASFATNGGKGKDKGKKPPARTCPGKECGKTPHPAKAGA
jgi:hypothetical protein